MRLTKFACGTVPFVFGLAEKEILRPLPVGRVDHTLVADQQ